MSPMTVAATIPAVMVNAPIWQNASAFAARAHRAETRKDGQTPYFSHVVRVALTASCVFGCTDEAVIAAALLHDTIEDTRTDFDDLHKRFGREIADLVSVLTKDMRLIQEEREEDYDRRLAQASWKARMVKLADVYDNLHDSHDGRTKRKSIEKARRAVQLATKDPELRKARLIVEELIDRVAAEIGGK